MNQAQAYPYKCTYCGRSGKYKATSGAIAAAFKCPHDGAALIVQEPASPFKETVSAGGVVEEVKEFAHKISDAVAKKLKGIGVNL